MTRGITAAIGEGGTTRGITAISGDGTHGTTQDTGAAGMDIRTTMPVGMAASVHTGDITILCMVLDT